VSELELRSQLSSHSTSNIPVLTHNILHCLILSLLHSFLHLLATSDDWSISAYLINDYHPDVRCNTSMSRFRNFLHLLATSHDWANMKSDYWLMITDHHPDVRYDTSKSRFRAFLPLLTILLTIELSSQIWSLITDYHPDVRYNTSMSRFRTFLPLLAIYCCRLNYPRKYEAWLLTSMMMYDTKLPWADVDTCAEGKPQFQSYVLLKKRPLPVYQEVTSTLFFKICYKSMLPHHSPMLSVQQLCFVPSNNFTVHWYRMHLTSQQIPILKRAIDNDTNKKYRMMDFHPWYGALTGHHGLPYNM
jgi:hypothetical protein